MSYQECALYGELVLWLRDRGAELLAGEHGNAEAERERLDRLIRDWFFTPQDDLHGCAPRELIWAEQMGKPNPIDPARVTEFFDDDCPVCEFERENLEQVLESGEDSGFHWYHDDGGCPLIARYDPEGWDDRWSEEDAWLEGENSTPEAKESPAAAHYEPPQTHARQLDPSAFLSVLKQPWLDPALHQAAQKLVGRCDVPVPDARSEMYYRRITLAEALSLLSGLDRQGVDIAALLAQIDAWPYENVALDWLSEPEKNVALMCQAMEQQISPDEREEQTRFRQHRDFVLVVAQVVPPGARLWLQGWLEAVVHGAFTPDIPF